MDTTKSKIPKLRFPEFSCVWDEKRIEELGRFLGGGTPESSNKEYWQGNIPWISSSDIKEGSVHQIDKTRYITKIAISESATKIIPKGSVLMVSRVGIGKFAVANEKLCTSQDFTNLITNEDSYFIAYYFKARARRFVRLSQGTSIQGFTGKDIKNAKFAIPPLPEQQKIASFLTTVDAKIEQLTKKKSLLEQYKKGVMQQIFSQQLRFKDEKGNDYPDWEEKKLGEIGEFKNGINKGKNDFGFGVPFINLMDVFGKSTISDLNLDLVNANDKELEQYELKKGDVLFIRSSVKKSGVGETSVVLKDLMNTVYSGFLIRFRDNKIVLDLNYKKYCFSFRKFRQDLVSLSTTSANTNINQESLNELKIQIPYIGEQIQIANFLSAIDTKIELINTQIGNTQRFKKGLLQQMFV